MIVWAVLHPVDGTVRAFGSCTRAEDVPDDALTVPDDMDVAGAMRVEGQWLPRPRIAGPVRSGDTVTWDAVPAGTRVTVTDIEGGYQIATLTADGPPVVLTFAESGAYLVEMEPPSPCLPAEWRIDR